MQEPEVAPPAEHDTTLVAMSVRDLLDRMRSSIGWRISIAQRPFEWDEKRIINLVDSLLRGFPVGSILTIESGRRSYELSFDNSLRKANRPGDRARTQVLDGQQRCASILATFGGEGLPDRHRDERRRLFVNVAELNPAAAEMGEIDAPLFHFQWASLESLNKLDAATAKSEGLPRNLPDAGWLPFGEAVDLVGRNGVKSAASLRAAAGSGKKDITRRLASMIDGALRRRCIPVHQLKGTATQLEDLHKVFIRINTGGLALSAVDTFFAGVKYYWANAEEQVSRLTQGESLLGRRAAISILGRCAAMSLDPGGFDPVRLNLRHLARAHSLEGSNRLVTRMQALVGSADGRNLHRAVTWVSRLITRNLHERAADLPAVLLSVPIGWAYRTLAEGRRLPRIDNRSATTPIVAFLFWTRVFRSSRYGRQRFERLTFRKAWAAAGKRRPFPFGRRGFNKVCFNYHHVLHLLPRTTVTPPSLSTTDGDAGKIHVIMNLSRHGFLSVFQKLEHAPTDIDHFLADNYARKHFREGRGLKWSQFDWVQRIGNFALIDARANRVLQDRKPSTKLGKAGSTGEVYRNHSFLRVDPNLNSDEERLLLTVEREIKAGNQSGAADVLREFVGRRSARVWEAALAVVGPPPLARQRANGDLELG